MKTKWRNILAGYKASRGKKAQTILKDIFPSLLKQLIDSYKTSTKSNLEAGFRKTGIFPLDPHPVLNRLPRKNEDQDESINISVSQVLLSHLQEWRCGTGEETAPRRKKRRLDVEPGKSVGGPVDEQDTSGSAAEEGGMEPPNTDEQQDLQDTNGSVAEAAVPPNTDERQDFGSGQAEADYDDETTEEELSDSGSDPEWDPRNQPSHFPY